jgi:molybdate/tungstate transport system ATP-binding protein
VIEARVKKKFEAFQLDANISGEKFICLTGGNGAGKTTLLSIIAGTIAPDEGEIKLNSKIITNFPIEKRNVVLITPESCIPHLDVETHLIWGAKIKKLGIKKENVERVKSRLKIHFGGKVSSLSLGMRGRVALATALISRPELILVDEAFSHLDEREDFIRSYRELAVEAGIDVIFATQNPEEAEFADYHYNMVGGKAISQEKG